jgi:hypothetical protein
MTKSTGLAELFPSPVDRRVLGISLGPGGSIEHGDQNNAQHADC